MLQAMRSQRVGHNLVTKQLAGTHITRRHWAPCLLPRRYPLTEGLWSPFGPRMEGWGLSRHLHDTTRNEPP